MEIKRERAKELENEMDRYDIIAREPSYDNDER